MRAVIGDLRGRHCRSLRSRIPQAAHATRPIPRSTTLEGSGAVWPRTRIWNGPKSVSAFAETPDLSLKYSFASPSRLRRSISTSKRWKHQN